MAPDTKAPIRMKAVPFNENSTKKIDRGNVRNIKNNVPLVIQEGLVHIFCVFLPCLIE